MPPSPAGASCPWTISTRNKNNNAGYNPGKGEPRLQNPTVDAVAAQLCNLEGGVLNDILLSL